MKNNLSDFFRDGTGALSSMRLVFILWAFGIFGLWAYTSIENKKLETIPKEAIEIFAVCAGAKCIQSFSETDNTTPPSPPK